MGILQRVQAATSAFLNGTPSPSTKTSSTVQAIVVLGQNHAQSTPRNYATFAGEGYKTNVTVFTCINEIALAVSGVDWKLFKKRPGGRGNEEIFEHPLLNLIKHPNPNQSMPSYFFEECAYNFIAGNSYQEGVGPTSKDMPMKRPPVELWNLRPDRMRVKPGMDTLAASYEYEANGIRVTIEASHILHRKRFNPLNDYYGLSPIEAGSLPIDTDNISQRWNLMLLRNNGKPSGMVLVKGQMSDEQRAKLNDDLKAFQGPEGAGKILKLEAVDGGVDWKQISLGPTDLDWLNGRKLSKLEICQAFGVPPEIVGDSQNKTYSNYQEARKAFYMEVVLPYMDSLAADLNRWLTPIYGTEFFLAYDKNGIEAIQEDRKVVYDRALQWYQAGLQTANEAREQVGMPKTNDPMGDVRMVPFSTVPVTDIGGAPTDPMAKPVEEDVEDEMKRFNFKAFNLADEDQKGMHWKTINRVRMSWINKARGAAAKNLSDDWARIADTYATGGTASLQEAVSAGTPAWKRYFRSTAMNVGGFFAEATFRAVKSASGMVDTKAEGDWTRNLMDYYDQRSAVKIQSIQGTTLKKALEIINTATAAGLTLEVITGQLSAMAGLEAYRAERIARTEVIAASNYGAIEGARATGLDLQKEWISTRDDRTRSFAAGDEFDHREADGQKVGMDDAFDVSGESLGFPGDEAMAASPGNTINCRCTVAFVNVK